MSSGAVYRCRSGDMCTVGPPMIPPLRRGYGTGGGSVSFRRQGRLTDAGVAPHTRASHGVAAAGTATEMTR